MRTYRHPDHILDTPHAHAERGFTLIEIIVASVIGLTVATTVIMILQNGMANAKRATAGEQASRQTAVISEALNNDVRAARARGRDEVDDPLELEALIAAGGVGSADVRDVVEAGADRLSLRTRARAEGDLQCVTWDRDAAGTVRRSVTPGDACPVASPARTVVMGVVPRVSTATNPAAAPVLFTYVLLVDDDAATGDPERCHIVQSSGLPGQEPLTVIGRIVEVGASIDLRGQEGASTRRQASLDTTGIRSRADRDYRAALGCAW